MSFGATKIFLVLVYLFFAVVGLAFIASGGEGHWHPVSREFHAKWCSRPLVLGILVFAGCMLALFMDLVP